MPQSSFRILNGLLFSARNRQRFAGLMCSALAGALCGGVLFTAQAVPPAGSKWEPIPELTDEFEGVGLDATKWHEAAD